MPFKCCRRPQDKKSEGPSVPEAFSLLLGVLSFRSALWSFRRPMHAKTPDPLQISRRPSRSGRPLVSVAPSKYWRRFLDKQGVARLCTGGHSSLLDAIQFPRYPFQSKIRGGFRALKCPLVSWRTTFADPPTLSKLRGKLAFTL